MFLFELYYHEALRTFYNAGGSENEFYWLVSSILVRYPFYKEELELRRRLMELVAEETQGSVLDVGCGVGILTFRIALKDDVERVVGIDRNSEVVKFCNRLRARITEKAHFICADFLEFDFSECFDVVVFSYMLHDYKLEPFLAKAVEILESGGRIVIGDFDINSLRRKLLKYAGQKGLEVIKNETVGEAVSHGKSSDAFLLVLEI
ncbi:class I SAM-dependent methyltransferase [Thermococcus thermotolerans]|uniref:class I SAM-dependent methyltransferase n=1 Tax=Thermococcus thermotolerans TaxID=2969672 RepID=UPI002158321E|nr:class I SAM-dependent methyltransferase [Thermococcus thermotolerans]